MDTLSPKLTRDIERLIEQAVRATMREYTVRQIQSRVGDDQDGDEVILIDVDYDLDNTPVDTQRSAQLLLQLRKMLLQAGESRFPHIRHHFDERQQIKPYRKQKV